MMDYVKKKLEKTGKRFGFLFLGTVVISFILIGCQQDEKVHIPVHQYSTNETEEPVVSAGVTASATAMDQTSSPAPIATATIMATSAVIATEDVPQKVDGSYVVVIDAGHQEKGNSELEPIGPGATQKKAKVASGTMGVSSKVPEYKVTLQVSQKIKAILQKSGVTVIMVRETNRVNISNAQRAQIANKANADAFIRIHCNGDNNSSIQGALTMCQKASNPYCGKYYQKSRKLSEYVISDLCKSTGAKNKGIIETNTMSGINWCTVPVTIVEMGFMSNPAEDRKLVSDSYQNQLANGISKGIIRYLTGSK